MRVAIGTSSFGVQDSTPIRMLEEQGFEIVPNPHGRRLSADETVVHLEGAHGLIAGLEPLTREVLSQAPQLKAVARVGIGMDTVDQEAAAELGIAVSNTPDAPTTAVAEMTVAALLSLCRGLDAANTALHEGRWERQIGVGLNGTTVLIIGFGRIGRRVATLLVPFGAELLVVEPYFTPDAALDVELVELSEGLRRADVVSLHASGVETVLGAAEMARIKEGAFLLNSARGDLIDEEALIGALDSGRIRGAWLDAFAQEPYRGPLQDYSQVLLTPHLSTFTQQCRRDMEVGAVVNLIRDLESSGA